jgi:hypothetical protein
MFSVSGDSPDLRSAQPKCGGRLAILNYGEAGGIAKQLTGPLGAPFGASSNTLPESEDHQERKREMQFKVSAYVRRVFALVLVAGFVALTLSLSGGVASAAPGGNADVTFTKWVTATHPDVMPLPMVGVVGGNVGDGTFAGDATILSDSAGITTIHATYHFNGGLHSFTADLNVSENDATGIAKITGVVTGGWLGGAQVTGGYSTMSTCDMPTPENALDKTCFKGTLHIE